MNSPFIVIAGLVSAHLLLLALFFQARTRFSKLEKLAARNRATTRDFSRRTRKIIVGRIRDVRQQQFNSDQLFLMDLMQHSTSSGLNSTQPRKPRLVVSLTSIAPRLYEISTTIECLLNQTLKPDVIVLWLNKDKITPQDVPIELQRQVERGLTIRFCEDIGPHTKLVPALKEFAEDIVVTVDDDILYPFYLLEVLYRNYQKDPSKIYCARARQISVPEDLAQLDYQTDWPYVTEEREGLDLLPLGFGGVLYPPGILEPQVFNVELQKKLTPHADDIWFKAMSLKKGVVCKRVTIRKEHFPIRPGSQEVSLYHSNVHAGQNEWQIRACFEHFGLWSVLKQTPRKHLPSGANGT